MIRWPCVLGLLFAFFAAAACVDTTPIHVDEGPPPEGDAGTNIECRSCLEGEGAPCRYAFDLCQTLEDCPVFYQCVLARGCFAQALLEDRLACGQPCIDEITLTSNHPALPGVLAINDCTQKDCADECIRE